MLRTSSPRRAKSAERIDGAILNARGIGLLKLPNDGLESEVLLLHCSDYIACGAGTLVQPNQSARRESRRYRSRAYCAGISAGCGPVRSSGAASEAGSKKAVESIDIGPRSQVALMIENTSKLRSRRRRPVEFKIRMF